ncbi:hypothetical protein G6F40_014303 [Rhizopus arrhizus]|nr:hypothetical protein G6F40_014303 [Rhizopus arrhizus]
MLARIASTLALGLSLAVLAGCAGKQEAAARRQGEAVPVTAQVVRPTQWNDTLQALGTAKARESISVTAKVSEIVEKVHFESGQHIAAGAPIVTLRGQAQEAALVGLIKAAPQCLPVRADAVHHALPRHAFGLCLPGKLAQCAQALAQVHRQQRGRVEAGGPLWPAATSASTVSAMLRPEPTMATACSPARVRTPS